MASLEENFIHEAASLIARYKEPVDPTLSLSLDRSLENYVQSRARKGGVTIERVEFILKGLIALPGFTNSSSCCSTKYRLDEILNPDKLPSELDSLKDRMRNLLLAKTFNYLVSRVGLSSSNGWSGLTVGSDSEAAMVAARYGKLRVEHAAAGKQEIDADQNRHVVGIMHQIGQNNLVLDELGRVKEGQDLLRVHGVHVEALDVAFKAAAENLHNAIRERKPDSIPPGLGGIHGGFASAVGYPSAPPVFSTGYPK